MSTPPNCPNCGATMQRKIANHGKRKGKAFWGCPNWAKDPGCKVGINIDDGDEGAPATGPGGTESEQDALLTPRVLWTDGSLHRPGWVAQHLPVGGGWRALEMDAASRARHGASWVAWSDLPSYEPADADTVRVCGLVRTLLQRGAHAPVGPSVERQLLKRAELNPEPEASGDLTPRLARGDERAFLGTPAPGAAAAELDGALRYDSDEEEQLHREWVPAALGPDAARWWIPQASIGGLLRGLGSDETEGADARRADFLVAPPAAAPFVVEVDGAQHSSSTSVDAAREEALRSVGVDVLRVSAAEVQAGEGPGLSRIADRWGQATIDDRTGHLLGAPAQLNRALLGLLIALQSGFVAGDRWVVDLRDDLGVVIEHLHDHLALLAAVDELWGPTAAPRTVWLIDGDEAVRLDRDGLRFEVVPDAGDAPEADVVVHLQDGRSPVERLPERGEVPQVVVRPAVLPVELRSDAYGATERVPVRTSGDATHEALTVALQFLFAKESFREGQREALIELLEGRDTVVLLPTGGGKSLIYQLAGLLLPGATLVIDPIVALVEDQIRGLRAQGIDRVLGITSSVTRQGKADEALARVAAGDAVFVLVAPERMQMPAFRDALRTMTASTMVNVAVVDEAHCVSEWGHEFRTSYLRLGDVIRRTCADAGGAPPPLLALTGTASRAVLRDVLFELDIDAGQSPNSLIRPRTFDRPELGFTVSVGDPNDAAARLKGQVQALPQRASKPPATYFQPNGPRTNSGIVFATAVNGKRGITGVRDLLADVLGARPVLYAGKAPKGFGGGSRWEAEKRANARAFVENEVVCLAATKSFGMGIDKPNIRWVVHYGMPISIEAYYQEAGRAGRDGRSSECVLIFSELDQERAGRLLDPDVDLEDVRAEIDATSWSASDDVTSALWFVCNSFAGVDADVAALGRVVGELDGLGAIGRVNQLDIPFDKAGDRRGDREKALHRLVLLGVLDDYTVDWGRKSFGVRSRRVEVHDVVEALVGFVGRSQPARARAMERQVEEAEWADVGEAVLGCSRLLTAFVYDTIERSRRRSLREMWLAARAGSGDELRRRILDYLNEGSAAPVLEGLLDRPDFRFVEWQDALDTVVLPDDAAEWRGNSARLLVSEPDHPGLLLARSVTELRAVGGDLGEFLTNLRRSVESAVERYDVGDRELGLMARWLIDTVREFPSSELPASDVLSLLEIAFEDAGKVEALPTSLTTATGYGPVSAVVHLRRELADLATLAAEMVASYDTSQTTTPETPPASDDQEPTT